jgi:hypothetical protein
MMCTSLEQRQSLRRPYAMRATIGHFPHSVNFSANSPLTLSRESGFVYRSNKDRDG